jgi:hypothetical protein
VGFRIQLRGVLDEEHFLSSLADLQAMVKGFLGHVLVVENR